MNELQTKLDWEFTVKAHKMKHPGITPREVSIWQHRVTTALQRLPYLRSVGAVRSDDESDLHMKALLKGGASNMNLLIPDFKLIVKSQVIGNRKGDAAFIPTRNGLEIYLAVIDEEDCLFTGTVTVEAA